MLQWLLARWRLWKVALAEMDDPEGEYLLKLDGRVRRLEAEVEQLRQHLTTDALAAVAPTRAPES